ncbi:MAG: FtsW/RodA/SpoVE family cell cycle protein [Candidatus Dojkabacteria bacterium]|nr:FtsW/RodA/SpoVE family cell cycle protein [Candidatus Dojkabacteria bacterium]
MKNIVESRAMFLLSIVLLMLFGIVNIFTTTFTKSEQISNDVKNQLVFYAIGLLIIFFMNYLPVSIFLSNKFKITILVIQIILLVLVLTNGIKVGVAQRWLDTGIFYIQPAEIAKLVIALCISWAFNKKQKSMNTFRNVSSSNKKHIFLYTTHLLQNNIDKIVYISISILIIILVFLQNSLGNTIIILLIFTCLLIRNIFNTKAIYLFSLMFSAITGLLLAYVFYSMELPNSLDKILLILLLYIIFLFPIGILLKLKFKLILLITFIFVISFFIPRIITFLYDNILIDYQKNRIIGFLNPNIDYLGINWQRNQAIIAFGSGRLFGHGLMNGKIISEKLLPYAHTDFAFATIGEQFGFIGSIVLMSTYFYIFHYILLVFYKTESLFFRNVLFGIFLLIFFNVIQHIGMNIGVLPVTGMTLPLVSYGGTSVIVYCISFGIVMSIKSNNYNAMKIKNIDFSKVFIRNN